MSMESVIDIRHLRKSFGAHEVLKDIDFSVGKGEVACIIGSSGSGKSTLLRCINGLVSITSGEMKLSGSTGMVFQHFNLFPHMTCRENITYAPVKVKKNDKEGAGRTSEKLLKMV